MAVLNPKDRPPADEAFPAGVFILGIVWFKRKQGKKSGKDYLSVRVKSCSGPNKGNSFFTTMNVDLSKTGTVQRWNVLCEVLGIEETFEIGNTKEGNADEGDANFRRLFLGRAFKCEVDVQKSVQNSVQNSVQKSVQYTNNGIKYFTYPRDYTDADQNVIAEWERAWKEKGDDFGDPDDSPAGTSLDDEIDNRAPDDDDDLEF